MSFSKASRFSAALIALAGTAGLVLQFVVSSSQLGSPMNTVWVLMGYFTILTNVLVAVVFFAIACGGLERFSASVLAGTTLSIVLVGVIYYLLLHGLTELSGSSAVANTLVHLVTPVAVPVYWLALGVKGRVGWRDPLLWAIYPLAYFAYALLRGEWTRKYPYPFINVLELGWPRVLLNAALIAVAYMAAGYLLVAVDHSLATNRRKLQG